MKQYEEYIARYCQAYGYTPEEAKKHALCQEVEKYYSGENKAAALLKHKFICCSES